ARVGVLRDGLAASDDALPAPRLAAERNLTIARCFAGCQRAGRRRVALGRVLLAAACVVVVVGRLRILRSIRGRAWGARRRTRDLHEHEAPHDDEWTNPDRRHFLRSFAPEGSTSRQP